MWKLLNSGTKSGSLAFPHNDNNQAKACNQPVNKQREFFSPAFTGYTEVYIMCMCGEAPSFFLEKYPVARKEHRCCECFSTISKGEKYQVAKGVWDGKFSEYKTCEICHNVRSEAMATDKDMGECLAFGCLWETVGVDAFVSPPYFVRGECHMCGKCSPLRWVDFLKYVRKISTGYISGTWVDGKALCLTCRTSGEHLFPGETMVVWSG